MAKVDVVKPVLTDKELSRVFLKEDVTQGNVGMVVEHLADAQLPKGEALKLLAQAARNRADIKDQEALLVDASAGHIIQDAGAFERSRASALRKFADEIEKP